jgi:hypothetical protein
LTTTTIATGERNNRLPESSFSLLASDNKSRKNVVILLVSVDEDGYPRVCLLSPFQIISRTPSELCFVVYPNSKTRKNLDRTRKATLIIPESTGLLYVKGDLQYLEEIELSDGNHQPLFSMKGLSVSIDKSKEAPINSQMTFDTSIIGSRYRRDFELMAKHVGKKVNAK